MRIYLSKSNRANPDDLMAVRVALEKCNNVDIVEFTGRSYSSRPLLSCDGLIVVPPANSIAKVNIASDEFDCVKLGKGQYSEIETFKKNKGNYDRVFVLNKFDDTTPIFNRAFDSNVTENNWQTDYSRLELLYVEWRLREILTIIGAPEDDDDKKETMEAETTAVDESQGNEEISKEAAKEADFKLNNNITKNLVKPI